MKNLDITAISTDELLQRVGAQSTSNIWLITIISPKHSDEVIDELREMLEIFLDHEIGIISASNGVYSLIEQVINASESYLLLRNFESWSWGNWQKLDSQRSQLDQKKHGGILILSLEATEIMLNYAPNFVSWIGSRIFRLLLNEELLTEEERQERLLTLRKWSGKSDLEVIALAEMQKLPPDPEYGEWLILLNREDLIER